MLHLGGTRLPGGIKVTMDGADGAELVSRLGARTHVPIHYDDYTAFKSPLSDFRSAVTDRGLLDAVTWVERGETVRLPKPCSSSWCSRPFITATLVPGRGCRRTVASIAVSQSL